MDSATALHTTGGGEGSIPPELPGGNESIAADRLQPAADNGSNGIVDVSAGRDVAESSQGSTDEAGDAPCRTSTSPSADTAPKGANDTVSDDTASLAEKSVAATARTSEEAVSGAGATDGEIGTEPAPAVHTVETDEAEGRDEATAADLKREGNELFKAGRMEEALALYDEAVAVAPLRAEGAPKLAALHANRAACLLSLGRHEECIAACDDCLDLDPRYVKAMLRRVKALEKLDMLEEAQQDYEDILAEFPGSAAAKQGLERLRAAQKDKEEKLKTEMLDKLKGVGNSLLGHFGLSLDNFKVDQDAATGGYSINFQQGAASAAAEGDSKPAASQSPSA